jgi:hypothetical protein
VFCPNTAGQTLTFRPNNTYNYVLLYCNLILVRGCSSDSAGSEYWPVTESCGHYNRYQHHIKVLEFLD